MKNGYNSEKMVKKLVRKWFKIVENWLEIVENGLESVENCRKLGRGGAKFFKEYQAIALHFRNR